MCVGSLDHVKELAQVWKDVLNMNFGLKKDQVAALFSKCSFAAGKDFGPLVTECWRKFNPDNQALVDALGLICTFAIVSRADFSEKIDFVFKLFDFNGNGHISKDELTILVMASLLGMVRYFRPSKPIPSDAACESPKKPTRATPSPRSARASAARNAPSEGPSTPSSSAGAGTSCARASAPPSTSSAPESSREPTRRRTP